MNISVVIPTFDRAHLLPRAIDSVLAQTLAPGEVIIVDDGSSDATAEMVQRRYPECRYLYQDNAGVSRARNQGILAAAGDWIAFLDSDDEWLPTKLSAQNSLLSSQPDLRICHTEEIWIRNGRRVNAMKKHAKSGGWIFKQCLPLCVISPSAVMIKRELFNEVGLFDETLPACEDYDLWLRICAQQPVGFITEAQIIKYGGHQDQLSHKHWGMDRFRIRALEKIIDSGALQGDDRSDALQMLIKKTGILIKGAEKRGNQSLADSYRRLQAKHIQQDR